jgi:hypothetical protein
MMGMSGMAPGVMGMGGMAPGMMGMGGMAPGMMGMGGMAPGMMGMGGMAPGMMGMGGMAPGMGMNPRAMMLWPLLQRATRLDFLLAAGKISPREFGRAALQLFFKMRAATFQIKHPYVSLAAFAGLALFGSNKGKKGVDPVDNELAARGAAANQGKFRAASGLRGRVARDQPHAELAPPDQDHTRIAQPPPLRDPQQRIRTASDAGLNRSASQQ